jgi:hypothetical protein
MAPIARNFDGCDLSAMLGRYGTRACGRRPVEQQPGREHPARPAGISPCWRAGSGGSTSPRRSRRSQLEQIRRNATVPLVGCGIWHTSTRIRGGCCGRMSPLASPCSSVRVSASTSSCATGSSLRRHSWPIPTAACASCSTTWGGPPIPGEDASGWSSGLQRRRGLFPLATNLLSSFPAACPGETWPGSVVGQPAALPRPSEFDPIDGRGYSKHSCAHGRVGEALFGRRVRSVRAGTGGSAGRLVQEQPSDLMSRPCARTA